jgi:peptide/nickel transport system substrate-binding protein
MQRALRRLLLPVAAGLALLASPAFAQTLRIGLSEDPALLDPAQSGTLGERAVFASLCDKLVELSPTGDFIPALATAWQFASDNLSVTFTLRQGVVFHDGTPFNAAAVKFSLDRARTMQESRRKAELASVRDVVVVDDYTVRIVLSEPFSPLIAQLSDRAGMMVSPTAAAAATPAQFAARPVCAGPFIFVERVPQERTVVRRFDRYWNASQIHFNEVIYVTMPDALIRLANVQSGQLEIAERIPPTTLGRARTDNRLRIASSPSFSFNHLHINTGQPPRNATPLTTDPRVREALELSLDRRTIVQAVSNGEFVVGNQLVPPNSPYYARAIPVPARNVERARALLREAGHQRLPVRLLVQNATLDTQVAQIVQAMAREAGFDITIEAQESGTAIASYFRGDFELFFGMWSGRVDPDGNIATFLACNGAQNFGKYCNQEVDRALAGGRGPSQVQARLPFYETAARQISADRPMLPLFHQTWVYATTARLDGFTPYVDGIVRPTGLRLAN